MKYIANPRRAPRVPARLRARLLYRGLDIEGETEDVGPRGCLLVAPQPLEPGTWVRVVLEAEGLSEQLRVTARIAWTSALDRHRAGVAFAETQAEGGLDPFVWFERLLRSNPGLGRKLRHVPERLSYDTMVYLLPPPRFIVDFSPQEMALIAAVRDGATVEELLRHIEPERKREGRLIFALLTRNVLTLSRREASPPSAWRSLLEAAGLQPGLEVEGGSEEEVIRFEPLPGEAEAPAPDPPEILPSWLAPSNPGWTEPAAPGASAPPTAAEPAPAVSDASRPSAAPAPPTPLASAPPAPPILHRSAPDERPPLVRGPPARSPQAQQLFEQGLASASGGDIQGGIRLLRQALTLSPRDAEIARALGQLAFKDRKAPER